MDIRYCAKEHLDHCLEDIHMNIDHYLTPLIHLVNYLGKNHVLRPAEHYLIKSEH